jgi:hypothetical protein
MIDVHVYHLSGIEALVYLGSLAAIALVALLIVKLSRGRRK